MNTPISDDFDTAPASLDIPATTATQLTTARTSARRGIFITADPGNGSDVVYIGDADVDATHFCSAVTIAGGPVVIPISDASKLWVYTSGTGVAIGWASL